MERKICWQWDGTTVTLEMEEAGYGPPLLLLPALSSISTRAEMQLNALPNWNFPACLGRPWATLAKQSARRSWFGRYHRCFGGHRLPDSRADQLARITITHAPVRTAMA
jgi:hypothetical protein